MTRIFKPLVTFGTNHHNLDITNNEIHYQSETKHKRTFVLNKNDIVSNKCGNPSVKTKKNMICNLQTKQQAQAKSQNIE